MDIANRYSIRVADFVIGRGGDLDRRGGGLPGGQGIRASATNVHRPWAGYDAPHQVLGYEQILFHEA